MTSPAAPGAAPLAGIRVVDLSKILAGPYVTMSLADLGADVIKVEHPDGGDPTRRWGPPFNGPDAAYYLAANRGKRSVTLDLKSPDGQEAAHRLIAEADVVVENFRPGSALQEEFRYDRLSEAHPRLVVLHISAFGESGPLRSEPGYDMVAQAAAGLMSLTGEPQGPPVKAGYAMGDLGAALFGTIGVVSALVERARTGHGQYLTTSLYESQLALHINWATSYFATGETPTRLGSGHPSLVPYQAYPASDGHFVIATSGTTRGSPPTGTGWCTVRSSTRRSRPPCAATPWNAGAPPSRRAVSPSPRSGRSTRSTAPSRRRPSAWSSRWRTPWSGHWNRWPSR